MDLDRIISLATALIDEAPDDGPIRSVTIYRGVGMDDLEISIAGSFGELVGLGGSIGPVHGDPPQHQVRLVVGHALVTDHERVGDRDPGAIVIEDGGAR